MNNPVKHKLQIASVEKFADYTGVLTVDYNVCKIFYDTVFHALLSCLQHN
jgi:hypothetical protein